MGQHLKFTLKKNEPKQRFRFLTEAEIKKSAAELSGKLVSEAISDVTNRFSTKEGEQPYTNADAFQVAVTAVSLATSILIMESTKTGLPLEKMVELHTTLLQSALRAHMEKSK